MTINMRSLRERGMLDGGRRSSWLSWSYPPMGTLIPERMIGAVEYETDTWGDGVELRIARIVHFDPLGQPFETPGHVVRLATTPARFGGVRWWFVCPLSGQLVSKIHLPQGGRRFASQKALRLGYASQRETRAARAQRRARRLRAKIGGSVNLTEALPCKPKWMRWKTYRWHREKCLHAQEATTAHLVAAYEQIMRRPFAA